MDRLRTRMAELKALEIPTIVTGDYNVIPTDQDIWNPKAMADDALMQPQSRDAYQRLLHDGWTDAIATQNPSGGIWTYWDYQAGAWQRDHGFRIDHLLLSPELADRLIACGVDKDHRGREKPATTPPSGPHSAPNPPEHEKAPQPQKGRGANSQSEPTAITDRTRGSRSAPPSPACASAG
jgi:exodeoxyribonuclease-3